MGPESGGATNELEWIAPDQPSERAAAAPNRRALLILLAALALVLGAYLLGQSAGRSAPPAADAFAAVPETSSPIDEKPQEPLAELSLTRFLGPGQEIGELDLLDGTRVVLFCRNGTEIGALGTTLPPTLALVHVAGSGDTEQLLDYTELVEPQRRTNPCERCAPETIELDGEPILFGSCTHGQPIWASAAYVIARPSAPAQTALALELRCGITRFEVVDGRLVLTAEAAFSRNLHDERFPYPPVSFDRLGGRFFADDIELLDWNCDLGRSTQLADRYKLREDAPPSISSQPLETSIGVLGVHGPMVLGLDGDQCEQLVGAYWIGPSLEPRPLSPIADLIGVAPPAGHTDWYYSCSG